MMTPDSLALEQANPQHEGERLVLELGQALHRYGTPAHRIELKGESVRKLYAHRGAEQKKGQQ